MLTELILGFTVVLLLLWIFGRKPAGLPPGRWGLPLIGYIPLSNKYIDDHLKDFQKQFGDICVWRIGTQVLLIVHDYHVTRQMFVSQDFIDRPNWNIFAIGQHPALGVGSSIGAIWHNNRRFSLRQLRDLGMGKSRLSLAVQNQALKLVEALKEIDGKPEPITLALNTAIVNVIWQMVASKQFEKDDPRLLEFQKLIADLLSSSGPIIVPDIFPWVKNILPAFLFRKIFNLDLFDLVIEKFMAYFHEVIDEHRASLDPNDPRDLLDAYLLEMEEKKNDDTDGIRSEKDLTILLLDLFFAGSDTTTNTLKFIFLYLASYPEVQNKVRQEIDEVLPKGTLATMEDKSRLQYTEAIINEVLRKSSLANTGGLLHVATQDTQVAGYNIPKGTVVVPAFASIHHDPKYWDKPEQFLPERWLDSEGKLTMKKEGFLPFSVGKRNCIGESLSRMELLIFTVAVLQNFTISPPSGKMIDLSHDPNNPLTHDPIKQDVVFAIRE